MTQLVPNHWKKTDRNGSCKRIIHSPDPKLLLMLEIERESHSIYRKFFFSITWHHCVIAMRWMQSLTYPMLSMNDKVKQSFALLWLMADQLCTLYGCVQQTLSTCPLSWQWRQTLTGATVWPPTQSGFLIHLATRARASTS